MSFAKDDVGPRAWGITYATTGSFRFTVRHARFATPGRAAWLFLLACLWSGLGAEFGARAADDVVPGEILVKWRRGAGAGGGGGGGPQLQGAAGRRLPAGARVKQTLPWPGWEVVQLPPDMGWRAGVNWFRRRPEVALVEANRRWHLLATPKDPEWPRLFGMNAISAPTAWDATTGSTNIVAAVIDTGITMSHPDLVPNLWTNPGEVAGNGRDDDGNGIIDDVHGADFKDGDGDPTDDSGHGTHVSGTIGAAGGNDEGVAGVCWKVRLLGVRVGGLDGFADTANLARAFEYLVALKKRGVDVRAVNCSWAGGFPSALLKEAIEGAGAAGMLIVCAAGNDRQDNDAFPTYPSGYDVPEIITVAASTSCDEPANFSNFGRSTVDLAAPGAAILSTYPGGPDGRYAFLSGTSMAAPHVTGAAALLAARRPGLSPLQLKAVLMASADRLPSWEGKSITGGRLNVARALDMATNATLPAMPSVEETKGRITAVTRNPAGRWANGNSLEPWMSADGRWVVFASLATNLVAGDKEEWVDIFLKDTVSNTVVRVSQTAAGVGGAGDSSSPVISADGRYVAFVTEAANLVTGDSNQSTDVLVWDRLTRQIEWVSARTDGRAPGSADSDSPSISADGSVIAFASDARDLVANDRNGERDVFVRLRNLRTTERVSVTVAGGEAQGSSDAPSISGDGNVVAFHSDARNLVAGDTNGVWDVFVRDRATSRTEMVSAQGTPAVIGNSDSAFPMISSDGKQVAFGSAATNFDGRTADGYLVTFVHDRVTRRVTRVSGPPAAGVPQGDTYVDAISSDGRFISYSSDDASLAPEGIPGLFRAFVWDRWTGESEMISVSDAGYASEDSSFYGRLSGDGRRVVFASSGFNLMPRDGNGAYDVFLLDRGSVRPDLAGRAGTNGAWTGVSTIHPRRPQRISTRLVGAGGSASYQVRLMNLGASDAGSFVLRVEPGPGGYDAAWSAGWKAGTNGISEAALMGVSGWTTPALAAGSNLVLNVNVRRPGAGAGSERHAVRLTVHADASGPALDAIDLVTETDLPPPGVEVASRAWDGLPSARNSEAAVVSGDGRYIAFSTEADHLVASGDTNYQSDVFLLDRETRVLRRVSDASASDQADADSRYPTLSRDGRKVAFQSRASNLVTRDTNDVEDIFVRDIATGGTVRASASAAGQQGNHASEGAFLAAGGRYVAFTSFASNLVPGDGNQAQDVFVRDLDTGFVECISRNAGGEFGNGDSEGAQLTADGRYVLFNSYAGNLTSKDANRYQDVYFYDRAAGVLELISAGTNGVAGNGPSAATSISDDGRYVTFHSYASDLAPGAAFERNQAYLLDRRTRRLTPLSNWAAGLPRGAEARRGAVSGDGRFLVIAHAGACGGDTSSQTAVVNLASGATRLASVSWDGAPADDHAFVGRLSADGRFLAMESYARNLVGETIRPAGQVLVADLLVPGLRESARRLPEGPWRDEAADRDGVYRVPSLSQLAEKQGQEPPGFVVRWLNPAEVGQVFRVSGTVSGPAGLGVEIRRGSAAGESVSTGVMGSGGWRSPVIAAGEALELWVRLKMPDGTGGGEDAVLELTASPEVDPGRTRMARLQVQADVDGDGLADRWEREVFGNLTTADAETDSDGDGATDQEEFRAGTAARDAAARPALEWLGWSADGGVALGWSTVGERYYGVERAADAGAAFVEVRRAELGVAGGRMRWVDPDTTSAGGKEGAIYRLRVDLP